MKTRSATSKQEGKEEPDRLCDLRLYVTNRTPKSVAAVTNLKGICRKHLEDRCRIEVIDIEKNPESAKEGQIVAVPTLVKTFPLPVRRVIGDLSNTVKVLAGLKLCPDDQDISYSQQLH